MFLQLGRVLTRKDAPEVSFAYLAIAVRNACYTALRRRRRRAEEPGPIIEPAAPGATEEERMIVDAALRSLPAEQREVVYLKVFEGMTFHEIAECCAISINTAGSRYRYAMAALRRALAPNRTGTP